MPSSAGTSAKNLLEENGSDCHVSLPEGFARHNMSTVRYVFRCVLMLFAGIRTNNNIVSTLCCSKVDQ